jgi:hypothetical protein
MMSSALDGGMALVMWQIVHCGHGIYSIMYVDENGDSGKLSEQGSTRIVRTRPFLMCRCLLSLAEYMGSAASLTGEKTGEDGDYELMG